MDYETTSSSANAARCLGDEILKSGTPGGLTRKKVLLWAIYQPFVATTALGGESTHEVAGFRHLGVPTTRGGSALERIRPMSRYSLGERDDLKVITAWSERRKRYGDVSCTLQESRE